MTRNAAEKDAARDYSRRHDVSYRRALAAVRAQRGLAGQVPSRIVDPYVGRLLIEAIEGCGIRHWARVEAWDGEMTATIVDIGGETFLLEAATFQTALRDFLASEPHLQPLDLDSFHADLIIQSALFGGVIYRSQVRRRPTAA